MTRVFLLSMVFCIYLMTSSRAEDDNLDCFYEEGAEWSECFLNNTQTLRRELMGGKNHCPAVKVETRSCESGNQGDTTPGERQREAEKEHMENDNKAALVNTRGFVKADLAKVQNFLNKMGHVNENKAMTKSLERDNGEGRGRGGDEEGGRRRHGGQLDQRNHVWDGQYETGEAGGHGDHKCHGAIHDIKRQARKMMTNGNEDIDVTQFKGYSSLSEFCQERLQKKMARMRERHGGNRGKWRQNGGGRGDDGDENWDQGGRGNHGRHGCHEKIHEIRREARKMTKNGNEEIDVTQLEGYSSLPEFCQKKLQRKIARMRERHGKGEGRGDYWGHGGHKGHGGHQGRGGHRGRGGQRGRGGHRDRGGRWGRGSHQGHGGQ